MLGRYLVLLPGYFRFPALDVLELYILIGIDRKGRKPGVDRVREIFRHLRYCVLDLLV